jgi:hypothetical protein
MFLQREKRKLICQRKRNTQDFKKLWIFSSAEWLTTLLSMEGRDLMQLTSEYTHGFTDTVTLSQ